jgi:hypothetical protein
MLLLLSNSPRTIDMFQPTKFSNFCLVYVHNSLISVIYCAKSLTALAVAMEPSCCFP